MTFKKREWVMVRNRTFGGVPIIEGRAQVVRRIKGTRYLVRFEDDLCDVERKLTEECKIHN